MVNAGAPLRTLDLATARRNGERPVVDDNIDGQQIVPELLKGEYVRHCADCRHSRVRASLESKSGIEIYCGQGKWRDKSSHRKTFKRMLVVLDAANDYFRETAESCDVFESMAND